MREAGKAKKHLDRFKKRLKRQHPEVGGVWKMECQERGSIHFHLLVFGVPFIPYQWLADAWGDIVAPGDPDQLAAGTSIERAKSFWEARHYLEKYLGKTTQEGDLDDPGRYWGTWGLERFVSPTIEVPVTTSQAVRIARILDAYHKARLRGAWVNRVYANIQRSGVFSVAQVQHAVDMRRRRVKLGQRPRDDTDFTLSYTYMLRARRRRRKLFTRPDWAGGLPVASSVRWWDTPGPDTVARLLCAVF